LLTLSWTSRRTSGCKKRAKNAAKNDHGGNSRVGVERAEQNHLEILVSSTSMYRVLLIATFVAVTMVT